MPMTSAAHFMLGAPSIRTLWPSVNMSRASGANLFVALYSFLI